MNNVNRSSEGIYTCKAINDVGLSEAETKVLIKGDILDYMNKIKNVVIPIDHLIASLTLFDVRLE